MADLMVGCRSCHTTRLRPFLFLGNVPVVPVIVESDEPELSFPLELAFCPTCSLIQALRPIPPELLPSPAEPLGVQDIPYLPDRLRPADLKSRHLRVVGSSPVVDAGRSGDQAEVFVANDVMGQVPDLNSFVEGLRSVVKDRGKVIIENHYIRDLIGGYRLDMFRHEQFCYFSCTAIDALARRHGLHLNHIERLRGSSGATLLWEIGTDADVSETLRGYLKAEAYEGMADFAYYSEFASRVEQIKVRLLALLRRLVDGGATIAALGSAAQACRLLNYVGIGPHLVSFVVDPSATAAGGHMAGVQLPLYPPDALLERLPDYVVLLDWKHPNDFPVPHDEYLRRGGRFIAAIPTPELV